MNRLLTVIAGVCLAMLSWTVPALAQRPHAKITAAQARAAALKKYNGTVEGKIPLENEDGKWQYAVNVRSGKTLREIMVDANSGKVASVEVTTKAEEAREAAAEAAKSAAKAKHIAHKAAKKAAHSAVTNAAQSARPTAAASAAKK